MFNIQQHLEPFHVFTAPKTKAVSASARRPGNYVNKPTLSSAAAEAFSTIGRGVMKRIGFSAQMEYVNRVAGGEPRKVRRLMARARVKRVVVA